MVLMTAAPTTADTDIRWAVAALNDGAATYATYRRYLAGQQPLSFATEKFRTAFGRLFQAFAYNRCAPVIKAHANRLRVEGFGADDAATAQAAQDLWDRAHMDLYEGQVEAEALGLGDSYVMVQAHPLTGAVQLWPLRAEQVRVHYSESEPGVIDRAARRWIDEESYTRLNLYYRDRILKFRSRWKTPNSTATAAAFAPYQEPGDLAWPLMLNLSDTVPVFHFGNNAGMNDYGVSELLPVLPLQDGLNKTLMDMIVAMEFAAFPQRVLLNVDTDEAGSFDAITRFQSGIDRMLALRGSSDGANPAVTEFSAVNINQYLDVARHWDEAIGHVTQVPMHDLIKTGRYPSGASLRMDEAPFTAKIEDQQRAFGYVWADGALRYGLRLQGMDVAPGAIRVNWRSAAPMAEEDKLALALQKEALGFPFEQILKELGYEPDQMAEILALKQQAMARQQAMFAATSATIGPPLDTTAKSDFAQGSKDLLNRSDQAAGRA